MFRNSASLRDCEVGVKAGKINSTGEVHLSITVNEKLPPDQVLHFIGGTHLFFKDCDQLADFIASCANQLMEIDPEFKRIFSALDDDHDPELA